MKIKFLDLKKQYESIKNEIDSAIFSVLDDTAFIGGKFVTSFEESFSDYLGVKHCIGVASGTDALSIAIESLELPKGSDVIVPANTFIATPEAVTRNGYNVVFCDIDPDNYTLSIDDLEKCVNEKTSAIIAVHLFGHPCKMDSILEITKKYNLKLVEDCAHATGSEYEGMKVGCFGDLAAFSFNPGKNLGAYGDAGAIVTNDSVLAQRCRLISNHGRHDKYNHIIQGRNSRLDGIQAAILSVKLNYLDACVERRIEVADYYLGKLKGISQIILPRREEWAKEAYHLFVIRAEKRDLLQRFLAEKGIETGIHYLVALPKQKAYSYLALNREFLANDFDDKLLSIPIGDQLTDSELKFICDSIKEFYSAA